MLDKDIREKLYDYLDERYGKVRTIEEKVILKSRADMLAIIDGEIIGIEIKSDSDTYTRLKTQIKDYEKFCDKCYVAVGESHIHISEHVPDHWGIIVVSSDNVIVDRDASDCPKVKINNQLDILWRAELYAVQMKEGLPKLSNWKRRDIYKRLIETCGEEQVKLDLTEQLFERDYTIFEKVTSKKPVKKTKKASKSISGDRKRAHVTNYIAPKKRKK